MPVRHKWSNSGLVVKHAHLLFCVIFCLFIPPLAAADKQQAAALLFKMSSALRELNYSGQFTYEVGSRMDSYSLTHVVEDGREYEYLKSLNGPEQTVAQEGLPSDCLAHGNKILRGLIGVENVPDYYQLLFVGEERIADRQAMVVQILPLDDYRYGYVIALDLQTALPLRTMLIDGERRVLERFQFIQLTLDPVKPELEGPALRVDRSAECDREATPESQWTARWLPRGFEFTGERSAGNGDTMLTYTDGLATFTVFVGHNRDLPMAEKGVRRGATVAYLSAKIWAAQPFRISLVGEVPLATAQAVVSSLEYRAP